MIKQEMKRSKKMAGYENVMVAAEVNFQNGESYTEFLRGVIADYECQANGVIDHNTYTCAGFGYVTEIAFDTKASAITEQIFQGPKILKKI